MKRLIWQMKPIYSFLVGWLAAWVMMLVYLPLFPTAPSMVFMVVLAMSGILAGLLSGATMCYPCVPAKPWRREAVLVLGLMAGHGAGLLAILAVAGQLRSIGQGMPLTLVVWLFVPATYFPMRGLAALWRWWDRKRQESILLAMTHTHLSIAVIVSALFFVAGAGWIGFGVWQDQGFWGRLANPTYSVFSAVLLWSLMLMLLSIGVFLIGVAVLLPPSFALSYAMARRITRRIELLGKAASDLEQGDLSASTLVEGDDEIAHLQKTFNAMAGSIRTYAASLEDEKNKVTALLNAQQRLTVDVSHELRTPVATISSYLESILTHWDEREAAALRGDLEIISREVEHLDKLIDDLFALNTARVRKLSFEYTMVNPGQVARQVVDALGPAIWHTARVEVTAEMPASLPLIRADEQRLSQVLKNLVINGARYTPPGGFVCIAVHQEESQVCFEVSDSGQGVPADTLPHIWEPFYKVDPTSGGAGLGLALVKEFTETMGGSVAVHSEPGQGSTFFIRLPQA